MQLALSALAMVSVLGVQPSSQEALQSRIDLGIPVLPEGVHVRWRHETHAEMSREELEQVQARIAGKPDHPDRSRAEAAKRQLEHGPDVVIFDLYTGPGGKFRLNQTHEDGTWSDIGMNGGVIWTLGAPKLGGQTLTLLDAGAAPPPGRNFAPSKDQARRQVAQFTLGAQGHLIGAPAPRITEWKQTGSSWRCTVTFAEGVGEFAFIGVDEPEGPRVRESRLVRLDPAPGEVGARVRSGDYLGQSLLGPVDRWNEEYSPTGRLRFRGTLELIEEVADASVFAVPDKDTTSDAARGAVTITALDDFRNSAEGTYESRSADGDWAPRTAPASPGRARSVLDRVGLLTVVGGVLILFGAWVFRRRIQGSFSNARNVS